MACTNPAWFGCDTRFSDFTADAISPEMKRGWLASISDVSPQGDGIKTVGRVITGFDDQLNVKRGWQSLRVPQCGQDCAMVGATFTEEQGVEDPGWEQERAKHATCVAHWIDPWNVNCSYPCTVQARFIPPPTLCPVFLNLPGWQQQQFDEGTIVLDWLLASQPWTLTFQPASIPRTFRIDWQLIDRDNDCAIFVLPTPYGNIRPFLVASLDNIVVFPDNPSFAGTWAVMVGFTELFGFFPSFRLFVSIHIALFPTPDIRCVRMNELYGLWPANRGCADPTGSPTFPGVSVGSGGVMSIERM